MILTLSFIFRPYAKHIFREKALNEFFKFKSKTGKYVNKDNGKLKLSFCDHLKLVTHVYRGNKQFICDSLQVL